MVDKGGVDREYGALEGLKWPFEVSVVGWQSFGGANMVGRSGTVRVAWSHRSEA